MYLGEVSYEILLYNILFDIYFCNGHVPRSHLDQELGSVSARRISLSTRRVGHLKRIFYIRIVFGFLLSLSDQVRAPRGLSCALKVCPTFVNIRDLTRSASSSCADWEEK